MASLGIWTRHTNMRRFAPLIVGAMVAAGIGGYLILSGDPSYRVATYPMPYGRAGMQAGLGGRLEGQANNDGTACFWMGTEQDRLYLIWPAGYSARANPLRIIDDRGRVLALVGDYGQADGLGGGRVPDDAAGRSLVGCPTPQQAWIVAPD